jgi:hypothetical protein
MLQVVACCADTGMHGAFGVEARYITELAWIFLRDLDQDNSETSFFLDKKIPVFIIFEACITILLLELELGNRLWCKVQANDLCLHFNHMMYIPSSLLCSLVCQLNGMLDLLPDFCLSVDKQGRNGVRHSQ